jgi:hypothetical protein
MDEQTLLDLSEKEEEGSKRVSIPKQVLMLAAVM